MAEESLGTLPNGHDYSPLADLDDDVAGGGTGTAVERPRAKRRWSPLYTSALAASPTLRSIDKSFWAFYVKGRRRFRMWRALTPVIVLGAMTAALALVFLLNLSVVLHFLEHLGSILRRFGFGGYVACALMCFILCFPPTVGYSTTVLFCGFTFGFPMGFIPVYFGSLAGAACCFMLARRWFQAYVVRTVKGNAKLDAVMRAVEMKGFRLLLLIRLAPYPFTISNVMFAGTDVPMSHFVGATSLSLLKTALHVYVGSTLESLAKKRDASSSKVPEIVAIVIGGIIGVGVGAYLFIVARRAVEETLMLQRIPVDVEVDLEVGRLMSSDEVAVERAVEGAQTWKTSRELARSELSDETVGFGSYPNW